MFFHLLQDNDNASNDLVCELISDIPVIPPHKFPETLGKIKEINYFENDKQFTSSNSDTSMNC